MPPSLASVKDKARELGFDLCGVTPAQPSPTLLAYQRWIAAGMHGQMQYMAREDRVRRRLDLRQILPSAQSLIIVGLDYQGRIADESLLSDPARGRIATYAWGLDYHQVMEARLREFADWLASRSEDPQQKVYVDTGAILERSHAQQAGLGFIGKNTMLIHPRRGGSFFIGEIITSLAFAEYDQPHRETMCGTCSRCLHACPTDAFPTPFTLDSRRCISYHTIENKGWIPRDLRAGFGNWIFGCDICQDVCPFQRFAQPTREAAFAPPDLDRVAPRLLDLLSLDEAGFRRIFHGRPVARVKRERLLRNACVAAGNWRHERAIPSLTRLLEEASPLLRGHACWALWRTMASDSASILKAQWQRDDDQAVRGEIEQLLA